MMSRQENESVCSAPQLSTDKVSHVQEQRLTIRIPAPRITHHDTITPSTRTSTKCPKPNWLRPGRPMPTPSSKPSLSVGTSLRINRRPTSRSEHAHRFAPNEPLCASKTSRPPLHDASLSISESASPVLVDSSPPAERAGKRKAAEEAPPGDTEARRAAAAARARSSRIIGADESSKIMRNLEESRAAAQAKNRGRRVTVGGGEARDVGHTKRARNASTAAAPQDDDDDTDFQLTWRRKIGEQQVTSSSVSGIKVLRDDTTRFSTPRGVAPLGETAAPSEEIARVDAEPVTMLPTSGDQMADETQLTTNAQPMEPAVASSSVEWGTGSASSVVPAQAQAQPLSEVLDFSGGPSNITPQGCDPSDVMNDDSGSSSLPLSVSPIRNARKRALPAEDPLCSKKGMGQGKGKGKAKAPASEPREGPMYDSEKGTSLDTDVSNVGPPCAAATARPPSSKGKGAKAKANARMSHIEGHTSNINTTPRKRHRSQSHISEEDTSDTDVVPQARPVRNDRPRTKSRWRAVNLPTSQARPTQRLASQCSRPRAWAGSKDELLAALPALAKNEDGVAWKGLAYPTLIFSGERGDPGLGWWEEDSWENRKIVFSIVRETEVPLADPLDQPIVSGAHNPTDGGHIIVESQPPAEYPSNPSFDNRALPMDPLSEPLNPQTSSSSGQKDADPSRISVESPAGTASSQLVGPMDVSSCSLDRPPSILGPEFRSDRDGCSKAIGCPATFSLPWGAGPIPEGCPPGGYPAAEAMRVEGPPVSRANDPTPGGISAYEAVCDFSETRGTVLSNASPLSTREYPTDHSPQTGPAPSSPSESALPNLPCQTVLDLDATSNSAVSVPFRSENLPQPPPEVAALLPNQVFGNIVSPVLARSSPLVPWELPSEIGYFWLGLFRISEVKVETCQRRSTTKALALTVRRTWRFSLEWVPGGEDQLKDDEQGNYDEWMMHVMQPWWEPAHPQQPIQHPLFGLSHSHLLLPLPLLAPFTENSTATGNFPTGYYCTACGRINVQRYLRHRICEGAACNSRADPQEETGWAISAFSTRDRKVNSATVVPDDKWAVPTIAGPATAFDDGARLFHYHLAIIDSGTSATPLNLHPPSSGAGADADTHEHEHAHSVRHVFNGNREPLQRDASALFETLQRNVRIERNIGASVFAIPQIESGDYLALGPNGRSIWDQQAAFIESRLSMYCRDLGPLKVRALRVHAWISDGKHIQTFCPRAKHLVLLCLGADIAFLSFSGPNAKSNAKPKNECLRVTMVHGDIVVLSGRQFKFSAVRTGICMLLEAECI